jgi:uncharacterized protein YndB with AHSA1/START domain
LGGINVQVRSTIHIDKPIEQVFSFVTTPGNWPRWHPASLSVTGATDHSLEPGEQVTEEFQMLGRKMSIVWTVRQRTFPTRWVIDGVESSGARSTISYTLAAEEEGTAYERELALTSPVPPEMQAKVQAHMEAESAEALRRIKAALEGTG